MNNSSHMAQAALIKVAYPALGNLVLDALPGAAIGGASALFGDMSNKQRRKTAIKRALIGSVASAVPFTAYRMGADNERSKMLERLGV